MAQAAAAGDAAAALPAETMRCAGPAAAVGVREGVLWLLDARGQPFVLPVSHAGLRARSLALAGAPAAARSIAEQGAVLICALYECTDVLSCGVACYQQVST